VYPRYSYMKVLFDDAWNAFSNFVRDSGQAPPIVDQCEMTYTNLIDQGQGWNSLHEIGNVFSTMTWAGNTSFLPPPKTLLARLTFDIPNLNGRLHVSLQHVIKREGPANESLMMELTARGIPARIDKEGLDTWFAFAREAIVRGFTDLTSDTIHRLWEKE
jgi:hypothetical protein